MPSRRLRVREQADHVPNYSGPICPEPARALFPLVRQSIFFDQKGSLVGGLLSFSVDKPFQSELIPTPTS